MIIAVIILAVAVGALGVVVYFTMKFNNPFKLIFLFGKKGSGKTTMLVKYMDYYHKQGYNIYTNMTEVKFPYAVQIDVQQLGDYVAMPKSCVCLDEVGIDFDSRKFKTFKDTWRDYFKYQRQYKNVVIMTSQTWDVDKKVRDLTDKFYLCGKIGPVCYAREIRRSITLTDPMGDSESRIADKLEFKPMGIKFTWLPKWSKVYQSFNPPDKPFFVAPPVIEEVKPKKRWKFRKASA